MGIPTVGSPASLAESNVTHPRRVSGARYVGHVAPADNLAKDVRLPPKNRVDHLQCQVHVLEPLLNIIDVRYDHAAVIGKLDWVSAFRCRQAKPRRDGRPGYVGGLFGGCGLDA